MKRLIVFHRGKKLTKKSLEVLGEFEKDRVVETHRLIDDIPETIRKAINFQKTSFPEEEVAFLFVGFSKKYMFHLWEVCQMIRKEKILWKSGCYVYDYRVTMSWVPEVTLFQFPE